MCRVEKITGKSCAFHKVDLLDKEALRQVFRQAGHDKQNKLHNYVHLPQVICFLDRAGIDTFMSMTNKINLTIL